MSKILKATAREILDSRGNPTVECEIITKEGVSRASVPSGVSTGIHEACELRDGGKRFHGKGVLKAVENVNGSIARVLKGKDSTKQQEIDQLLIDLDGTKDKRQLGANAILAVSLAVARAGAASKKLPLYRYIAALNKTKQLSIPVPALNIINGGKHAGTHLAFQEYMILPTGAKSLMEAMQIASEVYGTLKLKLEADFGKSATNVGDEGGFAPPLDYVEDPLDYITETIISLGYWNKVKIGIDCAASTFWKGHGYYVDGKEHSSDEMIDFYKELVQKYPLVSIEDPFSEEDFTHSAELVRKVPHVQIVGDDLLVTQEKRIQKAIHEKSCNCLLLKMNQVGTLTESLRSFNLAIKNKWTVMVSHRSGETEDPFIADLAVGLGANQIKAGAPCRSERLAKYNQLLRIEEALGKKAKFAWRKNG
ncbi:MAG TPA: phosphopyruvate hydratase [Candidatus Nanoarchaeia archaeon]|nr:phosphopyruvate hydratase [Candidatus Nanoarchaeia archaeon]